MFSERIVVKYRKSLVKNFGKEGINMVKHVILWQLKEGLSSEDKQKVCLEMKEQLEALVGKVPGLLELKIVINEMESSNADVMLDSLLESPEALKEYQSHPDHVAVANGYVRPYTQVRMCIDYEI